MRTSAIPAAAVCVFIGTASADIVASAPDAMVLQVTGEVPLERDVAWARLVQPGLWWPDDHTYSGASSFMYIDAVAGGCFCELWDGGEVVHGRVVATLPSQMLRLDAPLGPLQGMGVSAVITFTLSNGEAPGSTLIVADFNVVGASLSGLDTFAPVVDEVFTAQVGGFLSVWPDAVQESPPQ